MEIRSRTRLRKPFLGLSLSLSLGLFGLLWSCQEPPPVEPSGVRVEAPTLAVPETATTNQVDDYHGTKVRDPYRWLEDLDSPETRDWIERQNEVTFAFLESIPQRDSIRKRLTELWETERYGVPWKRGDRYFFQRNDGLQNQSVLYVQDGLQGDPDVLLDPNALSADGTVALSGYSVSEDGRYLAYGLSSAGSDWQEWRVREVGTGQDLEDHLKWIKFSGASWTPDGQGFYYSRYGEPSSEQEYEELNYGQKLYYHAVGASQSDDALIYSRDDEKEWGFSGKVTDDGRYLIITVFQGTDRRNRVFYKGLKALDAPVVELLNEFDAGYEFIDNNGPVFWFRTDRDASRGRVIAVDTSEPDRENWKELIPETEDTLVEVSVLHDRFVATYLQDAHTVVRLFELNGTAAGKVELPGVGTASGFAGKRTDAETFFSFSNATTPITIFRHDLAAGKTEVFRRPEVKFDPSRYETRQVFYRSQDGTRIPMFITASKGLRLDGSHPTILYGYGGFNIPITPRFSVATVVWLELGGVYAVANLRGGGEYGEDWHQAGMKLKKQNVFDDFIAAAEWLVENRYTSSGKLAIHGGSNGGLLVGACMTQRPELFGAALPAVGVMDMLRFHKFTIGWAWVSEFGSPEDSEEFPAILAYSPLHNLKPGTRYPATLITTADHDDRVVPSHSFKFAAALQAAQGGPAPTLIRVETRAGHGAGKPTTKIIEETADRFAFLVKVLGMGER